ASLIVGGGGIVRAGSCTGIGCGTAVALRGVFAELIWATCPCGNRSWGSLNGVIRREDHRRPVHSGRRSLALEAPDLDEARLRAAALGEGGCAAIERQGIWIAAALGALIGTVPPRSGREAHDSRHDVPADEGSGEASAAGVE